MNILKVKPVDALNGPGIRCSIWVAGCTNNCKGCWAPDTWNPNQGRSFSDLENEIILSVSNPYISGVSLLGGDPFYWVMEQDSDELLRLLQLIKHKSEDKSIWCWTGYLFEDLLNNDKVRLCLNYIDVLVDGKFDINKRDLTLKFRGSYNQRIIDVRTGKSAI